MRRKTASAEGATSRSLVEVQIMPISFEQHEILGRLTVEAYRDGAGERELGTYEDELRAVSDRASDSVVLVAVDDVGTVLGGVTYVPGPECRMSEFDDGDTAGIRMLAVRPSHQGLGVGRALTEACIAHARAAHRRRIVLHSTAAMTVARGMYERRGFVRSPDLDSWVVEPPSSNDEPLHLMAYVFTL